LFGAIEGPVLIESTLDELRETVHRQILAAGAGGGYVLTSSNSIQLGIPPVNYLAMLEAGSAFGQYPLA
jgi:hypothetical protein